MEKKKLQPCLRSLYKRDLARMKESTAGQMKWLVTWQDLHTKKSLQMLGLLSKGKESFKKKQACAIASYGECASFLLYYSVQVYHRSINASIMYSGNKMPTHTVCSAKYNNTVVIKVNNVADWTKRIRHI